MDSTKKNYRKNIVVLIVSLMLVVAIVFGLSYAWLRLTKNSNVVNKITAGNLDLILDDTTSEGITLVNEVPRSYRQGMETTEYTFTLTNKNSTSSYKLSLADLEKYTDEDGKETVIADENRIDDSKIRYILSKDGEVATADKSKILTDRVIDSGTIKKGQTIKYSLRVWIDSRAENYEKAIKMYGSDNYSWWLRPAYSNDWGSHSYLIVHQGGNWNVSDADNNLGVSPAFRIA